MEGAKVYIQNSAGTWQKATVVAALGSGRYRVQVDPWEDEAASGRSDDASISPGETAEVDASKVDGGTLPFQNPNMPEDGFQDMTTLDHLHEAAVLHNLRVRFFASCCPYTYTADIVISVNPYRWFPDLYTDEKRKEYLVFDRSKLPPHAYATSSGAFSGLQETQKDQAILVSGESGAGKTETVKILMKHLALIASADDTSIITRIVESNPLLEAFGNAQTIRNDNSSRFGKFIELELNSACQLVGSQARTYLLEKSRVVGQDAGERNYHIFYQMLAADLETRGTFGLEDPGLTRDTALYTRMGASKTDMIEGQHDSEKFHETVKALALVGVQGTLLTQLLRAIAGVLLLGQINFTAGTEDSAVFSQESVSGIKMAAAALEVDVRALELALTKRTIKARNEKFVKPLQLSEAVATRDALAKELYSRIFDWLVVQICGATAARGEQRRHFVGLLDIFGFESFAINRFEQLCINYANEKLQQKFTLDVFKSVQQEYTDEGIPWDRIEFRDNAPVLAMIESKMGLVAMLNEECIRPNGSEKNYVSKLCTVHKADPAFSQPKPGPHRDLQFCIRHYAGSVTYTTTGWLERNRDTVSEDVVNLMRASGSAMITSIFAEIEEETENASAKSKLGGNTVVTKFKTSLAQLMETIGRTDTQYVRCIKPNKNKSPREVDSIMVLEQLRCAGVIEAIRVSRAGFPGRMALGDFVQRFGVLVRGIAGIGYPVTEVSAQPCEAVAQAAQRAINEATAGADEAKACRSFMALLAKAGKPAEQTGENDVMCPYVIGRTRVYFKAGLLDELEERRALLLQGAATEIASCLLTCQALWSFKLKRRTALKMQASRRMQRVRESYLQQRAAIVVLQSWCRAMTARRRASALRRVRAAVRLQSYQRRRVAMWHFARKRANAVRLQSAWRRRACRKKYLLDLAEFKDQAKLENQVKALQARLAAAEAARLPGAASDSPAATAAAPSEEILQALQELAEENKKLRMQLETVKAENRNLRQENQQLKAGNSTFSSRLASMLISNRQSAADDSKRSSGPTAAALSRSLHRENSDGGKASDAGSPIGSPTQRSKQPEIFPPLFTFWEDLPHASLPVIRSGSEVHIKVGSRILMLDGKGKHLMWQEWFGSQKNGYLRSMAFALEKRACAKSHTASTPDEDLFSLEDDILGLAFAIRSVSTGKYVSAGGWLDWGCIPVTCDNPEDASVFGIVPLLHTLPGEADGAAAFAFTLRLVGEGKLLSLRNDGYVSAVLVNEAEPDINNETMAASIELLLECDAYEITFQERQIGVTVSKDLPLRVVNFASVPQITDSGHPDPGPAECTGRVHIGDHITHVNGEAITDIPRQEAMQKIAQQRPVTLGFKVAS